MIDTYDQVIDKVMLMECLTPHYNLLNFAKGGHRTVEFLPVKLIEYITEARRSKLESDIFMALYMIGFRYANLH